MKSILVAVVLLVALSIEVFGQGFNLPVPLRKVRAPGSCANDAVPTWNVALAQFLCALPPGAGGGEANTGSNLGAGAQVFSGKVGIDFRFRSVLSASSLLTVTQNANDITLQIVPANFTLSSLGGLLNPIQIAQDGAATGQAMLWNGTRWAPGSVGAGGGGTVTSVALSMPASLFGVTGSPVTGSGTLTATLATQAARHVFMGPDGGSAAAPGFRALVAADLPASITSNTSGNAATATALAANPANCPVPGQVPTGIAANGDAEGCFTPSSAGQAPYPGSFTNQTTVTIPAATHGFNTASLIVWCYDNGTPRKSMPCASSVDPSTYEVVIGFDIPTSGHYIINGGVGPQGPQGLQGPPGASGGSITIQQDGSTVATQPTLNFTTSTYGSILCTPDVLNTRVNCGWVPDTSYFNTNYVRLLAANTTGASFTLDARAAGVNTLQVPSANNAAPTSASAVAYDSSNTRLKYGDGTNTYTLSTAPLPARGTYAALPSCTTTTNGAMYYPTDGAVGMFAQCNGSSWQWFTVSQPITLPAAAASWTVVNGGTLADSVGTLTFSKTTTGLGVALKALADTAAWDIQVAIGVVVHGIGTSGTNFPECGLYVTNGTVAGTSNARGVVLGVDTSVRSPYFITRAYLPINGSVAADGGQQVAAMAKQGYVYWYRGVRNGSNVDWYLGDGQSWQLIDAQALGFTATHFGIGCDPRGTDPVTVRLVSSSQ